MSKRWSPSSPGIAIGCGGWCGCGSIGGSREVINAMDPIDREVLTLRHFEELSNVETAQVLGIQKAAASNRYLRALKRLKDTLASMPGFFDN
jgi:Sigma-70, region 4